ncbi:hypothetical protein [Variovorax sp. ZT4R33]|uniref:hypothetical protein n=1 Tax=Variovorax sp. ZT4R33 TaxID=3443743 RepID=UPI003F47722A
MTKVSTRPQVDANSAQPPRSLPPRLIDAADKKPAIEFDSTAIDVLIARTAEIEALASCSMCLAAMERATDNVSGYEMIDDAMPLLADVMMRLAREARQASDQLWEQYQQARAVANGTEYSA